MSKRKIENMLQLKKWLSRWPSSNKVIPIFSLKILVTKKITKITIYTKAEKIYPGLIYRKIIYFCRFCFHLIYFVWLKRLSWLTLFFMAAMELSTR